MFEGNSDLNNAWKNGSNGHSAIGQGYTSGFHHMAHNEGVREREAAAAASAPSNNQFVTPYISPSGSGASSYVPSSDQSGLAGNIAVGVFWVAVVACGIGWLQSPAQHSGSQQAAQNQQAPNPPSSTTQAPAWPEYVTFGNRHHLEYNTWLKEVYLKDDEQRLGVKLHGVTVFDSVPSFDKWQRWSAAFMAQQTLIGCRYKGNESYRCLLLLPGGSVSDVATWALSSGVIRARMDAPEAYKDAEFAAFQGKVGNWQYWRQ